MRKKRAEASAEQGFSLIEAIVATGCLGLVIVAASSLVTNYQRAVMEGVQRGEKEDLRRYLRRSIDCEATVAREGSQCTSTKSSLRAYQADGSAVAKSDGSLILGDYELDLSCVRNAYSSIEINASYRKTRNIDSKAKEQTLFDIPIECSGCPKSIQTYYYYGSTQNTECTGSDLLVNGSFDALPSPPSRDSTILSGPQPQTAPMGFSSDYGYDDRCLVPAPTVCKKTCFPHTGLISVRGSLNACHLAYADLCADSGRKLVVNFAPVQSDFWCETLTPVAGKTYEFSARFRTAVGAAYPGYSSAFRFYIKGIPSFDINANPRTENDGWETIRARWTATSSSPIDLCGMNIDTSGTTGDLAVDDIGFRECP